MATSSAPTHRGSTARQRRTTAVAPLLIGALAGAALVVLLQLVQITNGPALDPAGAECTNAFDAFRQGERTSSLLQVVDDCTAEAR